MWETITSFAKQREFWLVVAWIVTVVAVVVVVALLRTLDTVEQLIGGYFDIAPTPAEPPLWVVFRQVASACEANPQWGDRLQFYERLLELALEQHGQGTGASP